MAITLACSSTATISLAEYLDYVRSRVDLRDLDSLAASAPQLQALANDRELIVRGLNLEVERAYKGGTIPSAQALMLAQGEHFYVRAAIWPSSADIAKGHLYQDQFAYNEAHDHNFTFLTVNYLGPGYETDIYEYDCDAVEGYPGEPVDLRFLEHVRFAPGMAMIYRAGRDVHVQHPPSDLSISLNLIVALPEVRSRDQYFFDLTRKTIASYAGQQDSSRRVSLLQLAAAVGDEQTQGLLAELAHKHLCRRTRLAAFEALSGRKNREQLLTLWQQAAGDRDRLVVRVAKERMQALERTA